MLRLRQDESDADDAADVPDFLLGGGAMGALMRATDWSATPLGSAAGWPQSLRSAAGIMLSSRYPIALYWGPELALVYNDAWSPIPGGKHPWALGRPAREVWPEIWDAIGPLFEQVSATGEGTWSEDQLLPMNRHGYTEECYFNFTFSPIRGEGGRVEGIFNAVVETTERVLGERRLRTLSDLGACVQEARRAEEACERAARILERNAADVPFAMIYLLDAAGTEARLVASANVPPGHPAAPAQVDLAGDPAAAPWPLRGVAETGEASVVRDPGALPGGPWPEAPTEAVVLPLVAPGQARPTGFLVAGANARRRLDPQYRSFLDLAAGHVATAVANARAYEEERRRAEALAELDRAKTAFFSNISHEFRTPLTLIMGPLEELLAKPAGAVPADGQALLQAAHRNSLRLLRLVNTLLDFSRVEAGRTRARPEPVDLAALTAELAGSFRPACERAGLTLEVDCPPLPGPVHVDPAMWEKVVLNLLSNAFKFTFEGGISVSLRPAGDGAAGDGAAAVELAVRDTGTGIPAAELEHLFERFHRVEGARGRTHEGTGIGLALVRDLARLHGGEVGVGSEPGRGSTFTVRLPLGTAPLPFDGTGGASSPAYPAAARARAFVEEALRWLPPDAGENEAPAADPGPGDGARPRVLLAEDNADMRDHVRRLLGERYGVVAVADGEAALAAALAAPPDLVLSDVMMPGLDGLGLLKHLRADRRTREVPVVLLSARAGEDASVEGLDAGADDYLAKPFSARELLARVGANLEAARLRRRSAEALRESEERYRLIVESATDFAIMALDLDGHVTSWNTGAERILGYGEAEILGRSADVLFTPEDRAAGRPDAEMRGALETQRADDERWHLRQDGSRFWASGLMMPLRDEAGGVRGFIKILRDRTDKRREEEHRRLLLDELNHRVKNTLATVQSLVQQTMRTAGDPAAFRDAFASRLMALSRAHDLLTRGEWRGASLAEVVRQTLDPYADGAAAAAGRVSVAGPPVRLSPNAAVTLNMTFHELATNAAKYGALAAPTGTVEVAWTVERPGAGEDPAGGTVEIVWRERGGPPVEPPTRQGFGTRLIERGVRHELAGEARLDFAPGGVVYRARLPLPAAAGRA